MNNILSFLRRNWLVCLLLVLLALALGWRNNTVSTSGMMYRNGESIGFARSSISNSKMMLPSVGAADIMMPIEVAPVANTERIVVQDTTLSMLVKDVATTIKGIEKITTDMGGFMVSKGLVKPEGAASGHITIRIPSDKRESGLEQIRALGIKVTNEDVFGNDVTDQYVDIESRLQSLNSVKAKMEAILDQAINVQDLVNVQNQINSIQNQIDNLKGQQKYLEQTAKLTRISINLSTDELSLPYSPDKAWRPSVVFKLAVRSMIGTLRAVADMFIWIIAYIPLIALGIVAIWAIKLASKRMKK